MEKVKKMEKNKKIRMLFLLFVVVSLVVLSSSSYVGSLTNEGGVGINAGGPTSYPVWFKDYTGVLIVTSTFANGSGIEFADITTVVSCIETNRTFRLRIFDSDDDAYIEPDNEIGLGTKERRFSVMVHMDTNELFWTVQVTSENGLIIFAELILHYYYDPNAQYQPVDENRDLLDPEEVAKTILGIKVNMFIGGMLTSAAGVFAAIFYIRRMK